MGSQEKEVSLNWMPSLEALLCHHVLTGVCVPGWGCGSAGSVLAWCALDQEVNRQQLGYFFLRTQ